MPKTHETKQTPLTLGTPPAQRHRLDSARLAAAHLVNLLDLLGLGEAPETDVLETVVAALREEGRRPTDRLLVDVVFDALDRKPPPAGRILTRVLRQAKAQLL